MLRLLIISVPGGPMFECGERISSFHRLPFFTFELIPHEADTYFTDKIPEITMDTGDMTSGSGQQQYVRDPRLLEKDKQLDSAKAIPQINDYRSITDKEYSILSETKQWICVSQIPDERLADLATAVVFLNTSDNKAIEWFSKRRKCPSCGNVHHLEDKPPKNAGICDRCGTDLIIKPEDNPSMIKKQFTQWRNSFWRLQTQAKHKNRYRVYSVDKFNKLYDLISRINLDYRGYISKPETWYKGIQVDVHGGGLGPTEIEIQL